MAIMDGSVEITHGGERLQLLPQRAVYWPAQRALIVADVHLGKGTAFRAMGLPVPSGSSAKDLQRLTALLAATAATRLIILGDLIHGHQSHQPALATALMAWRREQDLLDVLLVRGNHDRRAGRLSDDLRIVEVEEPHALGGLVLQHDPAAFDHGCPALAGHVHPVIAVRDFDRSRVALPCFVFDASGIGVLPSFGSFTGGARVERAIDRQCYVCTGTRVVRLGG